MPTVLPQRPRPSRRHAPGTTTLPPPPRSVFLKHTAEQEGLRQAPVKSSPLSRDRETSGPCCPASPTLPVTPGADPPWAVLPPSRGTGQRQGQQEQVGPGTRGQGCGLALPLPRPALPTAQPHLVGCKPPTLLPYLHDPCPENTAASKPGHQLPRPDRRTCATCESSAGQGRAGCGTRPPPGPHLPRGCLRGPRGHPTPPALPQCPLPPHTAARPEA